MALGSPPLQAEEVRGRNMTLLTIEEAALFLRLTKRTLYQRLDIPRVRYGHRVMFIEEELKQWVLRQRDCPIDERKVTVYHRNPVFSLHKS
jgi:excisionase family DNA binding protein